MGLFKSNKKKNISDESNTSDFSNAERNKVLIVLLLIAIGFMSFTVWAKKYSDPSTYENTVRIIDEKKNGLTALSAVTTSASLVLGAVPGDALSPLANQFADFGGYMLVISAILYFEKYALTIIGLIVFKYIFPTLCILLIYAVCKENNIIKVLVGKIFCFSLALLLFIPTGAKLTSMMDEQMNESMNNTITEIEEYSEQDISFFKAIKNFTDGIVGKAKNWISDTTERIAMFFVTSCLVPLFMLFVFMQITNVLFGTNLNLQFVTKGKNVVRSIVKKEDDIIKQTVSNIKGDREDE